MGDNLKFLNKSINIVILLTIIYVLLNVIIYFFEPLFYNNGSKGKKINEYKNYVYIENSLREYLEYYSTSDYEALKKCTATFKRKDKEVYNNIFQKYIKDKNNTFYIKNIESCFNNLYIIEYYYGTDFVKDDFENLQTNKIIIKINELNKSFRVYYDSLLDQEW